MWQTSHDSPTRVHNYNTWQGLLSATNHIFQLNKYFKPPIIFLQITTVCDKTQLNSTQLNTFPIQIKSRIQVESINFSSANLIRRWHLVYQSACNVGPGATRAGAKWSVRRSGSWLLRRQRWWSGRSGRWCTASAI